MDIHVLKQVLEPSKSDEHQGILKKKKGQYGYVFLFLVLNLFNVYFCEFVCVLVFLLLEETPWPQSFF